MSEAKKEMQRLPDPARVRRCGIPDGSTECRDQIPGNLIMCIKHWDRVPDGHRLELSAAWRALRNSEFGSSKRYLAAQKAAKRAAAMSV